ncbi:hypothetical protein ACFVS2_21775 [Brevibacillus sp. NPDC058079]|uniref:hypothetical protein n=1 Tax=Brevibacillus sp. NPDC058079 TaxID=3346330 RepID=UPI0036E10D5F
MKSINELVQEAHGNAVSKGWWDKERSFGESIALIHSEASEALEDYRANKKPTEVWYEKKDELGIVFGENQLTADWKPCGIPSEMADIVIRVMDVCGWYGIDLEQAIVEKMTYNASRPQRHGGKKI